MKQEDTGSELQLYVGDEPLTCCSCMKKTWACFWCSPVACEFGVCVGLGVGI